MNLASKYLALLSTVVTPSLPIERSYPKRWYLSVTNEGRRRTTLRNS